MSALDALRGPPAASKEKPGSQGGMSPENAQALLQTRLPGLPVAPGQAADVLSFVGSLLPGPAGIAGAGGGAVLGETVNQGASALLGQGFDASEIARKGKGAAIGATVGLGAGKVLKTVGGTLSGRIREQAVERATAEYAKATQAGVTIDPYKLLAGLEKLTQRAGRAGQSYTEAVLREATDFLNSAEIARPQTPLDVQQVRQVSDEIGKGIHEAIRTGQKIPDPTEKARAAVHKLIADNARKELRMAVPAATKHEATASRAIGARRILPNAPKTLPQSAVLAPGATIGLMAGGPMGAPIGALAQFALTQPAVIRALGHLIDNPAMRALLTSGGAAIGRQ